ncbi:MAG: hypothetical protein GW893_03115 [Armatimonadetes bacterium]|nr:hypothetical protein [Armatimonadota bacterium]PIX45491.1 MAG: hypothetical protein COZ56_01705 [Armatimonadetes bacterium CG_4_8_14_3_um_filter_58_9]PJB71395.1 MAG: hypothetical protein CO095_08110 [Armatimonadetes bacterium CG_4_9_14_3_um_filter_58_7]
MPWREKLFPSPQRHLPFARGWNIICRALHIVAFSLLLGGHFFAVDHRALIPVLLATVATGGLLMAVELYPGCQWLFMGSGLSVVAKLILLCMVPFYWEQRVAILIIIAMVAAVSSHMPAWFRHYSILERRIVTHD